MGRLRVAAGGDRSREGPLQESGGEAAIREEGIARRAAVLLPASPLRCARRLQGHTGVMRALFDTAHCSRARARVSACGAWATVRMFAMRTKLCSKKEALFGGARASGSSCSCTPSFPVSSANGTARSPRV
eukprot:3353787-Pleurochrysis_carterae.AAC.1